MSTKPTNQSPTQLSRKARHKTAILAGTVLAAATLGAHATTILSVGFETSQNYHAGTVLNTGHQLIEQTASPHVWTAVFGVPNFDAYTYAGAQVAYTPSLGLTPNPVALITPPQNPNGGDQFAGSGKQDADMVAGNFSLIASGSVEFSVDYFPGEWFDNSGGNYNGGFHLRHSAGNNGGFSTGRGSAQLAGDLNGNGPWAPQWAFSNINGSDAFSGTYRGIRYDGVAGFDNLSKAYWHRIGVVFDAATGKATQFKVQELTPGGNIWTMDNPVGALGQDLYLDRDTTSLALYANTGLRLYNVGNGTLSAYDNLYAGDPVTWTAVVPEPSTVGLLLAGLSALGLVRRRK